MSDTTNKTRTPPSASEMLDRLEQEKARVYRAILRDALAKHPGFEKMRDSYRKVKRYLSEAESILTADGFAKQKDKLEERIADLQEEVKQLTAKRNAATAAINSLRTTQQSHETVHEALNKKLVTVIEGKGGVPATEDEVNRLISEALTSVNADALNNVTDPFATFRKTKTTAEDSADETK